MAADLDINADPFLKLLTDALRAGPGSPEWHQAVAKLRETGNSDADEYRLLINAREHLEDGKEYRSVRAGPGFEQKLMRGIDDEVEGAKKPRGLPMATLITLIASVVIVALVGMLIYIVYPRGGGEVTHATVEDLARVRGELLSEMTSPRFEGLSAPAGVPDDWRAIGLLTLANSSRGLHLADSNAATQSATTLPVASGGGMIFNTPIPADEPFAAEVELRLAKSASTTLFEFFVTTDAKYSSDRGTSSNDLVWLLQDTQQKVMLDGQEQINRPRPAVASSTPPAPFPVRILMNKDSAIVEVNGQRIWDGAHGLPPAPRYVGIRFLRSGAKGHDPAFVLSVKVMKK